MGYSMKMESHRFFSFSLAVNLALGMVLLMLLLRRTNPPPAAVAAPSPVPVMTAATASKPVVATGPSPASPFPWRRIESRDCRRYVANLRAVDCPEWLVRDILVAAVDRLYPVPSALAADSLSPWDNADRRQADEHLWTARQSVRDAEKQSLIRESLGYDWDHRDDDVWRRDPVTSLMLGFLPEEKAAPVAALDDEYDAGAERIREEAHGILIDDDRARLERLYEGWADELARLLDPSELDELGLRVQAAGFFPAYDLQLDGLTINDAELRELARASKLVKDVAKDRFVDDPTESAATRAARQAAFETQVRSLLGTERFADYQRAQDAEFRAAYRFTRANDLSRTAAVDLYEAQRTAEDQLREIDADAELSPPERLTAVTVLKAATADTISSRLGGAYRRYLEGPGQWLKDLAGPPDSSSPGGGQ